MTRGTLTLLLVTDEGSIIGRAKYRQHSITIIGGTSFNSTVKVLNLLNPMEAGVCAMVTNFIFSVKEPCQKVKFGNIRMPFTKKPSRAPRCSQLSWASSCEELPSPCKQRHLVTQHSESSKLS